MSTFEDDACDAYEYFTNFRKHNAFEFAKDETKKSEKISRYIIGHIKTENTMKIQVHETKEHQEKCIAENTKEWVSSTGENTTVSDKPVIVKENLTGVVECNIDHHMSTSVTNVIISTPPLMHNLENKGVLIKDPKTAKRHEEFAIEKSLVYLGPLLKNRAMKDAETLHRDDATAIQAPKTFTLDILAKNDVTSTAKYFIRDIFNDVFSANENQEMTIKFLDKVVKDIDKRYDNEYIGFRRSNTKLLQRPVSVGDFKNWIFDSQEIYKKSCIKTLGDALTYFGLFSYLGQLDMSVEDLRRNKKRRKQHADFFKKIDKEIQKLSFKYHPDKVINGGGTEEEIATAQSLQSAINTTRTVLKFLNSAFLEDIGTDHKFGFYTNLSISSLSDEDEIKYRIYEVIIQMGGTSRIKQQNIILEIRKFLIESKNCIASYLDSISDFEKYRNLAFSHLKNCIEGFNKICLELKKVKEQCKSEKNGANMHYLLENMERDRKRDLSLLKSLDNTAKSSLKGEYQFFSSKESMDPYFVLPLVSYTNVILMCNVMVRNPFQNQSKSHTKLDPYFREDMAYLKRPYYLSSYCSGKKHHEKTVLKIMDKKQFQQGSRLQIKKIKLEFYKCITQINEFMECKFKVEDYNNAMTTNLLILDLKKCMAMMTEFQEKQEEISQGIQEFLKKTEKIDEKFNKIMQMSEELDQKVRKRLKLSKKLIEKRF